MKQYTRIACERDCVQPSVKERIEQHLAEALSVLQANGTVPSDITAPIEVTRTRDAGHGDLASNLAMILARLAGREPRDLALALIEALPPSDAIRDVRVAGPGFINFHLAEDALSAVIPAVLTQGERFGCSDVGAGQHIQVTFVLANPDERLHGSQARGAALADTVANLLDAGGFDVQRKVYVSDSDQWLDEPVRTPSDVDAGQRLVDDPGNEVLSNIRQDLADFGIQVDCWLDARAALSCPREQLEFLPSPAALRFHGHEHLAMTSPCGSDITLRDLLDEIGSDAARYFTVMRKSTQPLDVDLDLARAQSPENPVYLVQFAYARVCSVMRQLKQRGLTFDQEAGLAALLGLSESAEVELMRLLAGYPELVRQAALTHEPHRLTRYLRDLANGLHSYYNAHKVVVDNDELRHARMCLLLAVRQVLGNGLSLIGVSTPEVM